MWGSFESKWQQSGRILVQQLRQGFAVYGGKLLYDLESSDPGGAGPANAGNSIMCQDKPIQHLRMNAASFELNA